MTRLTKTSLFAVLGLTVAFAGSNDLLACGRGGGGYRSSYGGGYGGFSGGYAHRVSYSRTPYHPPAIQQPVRPITQQPIQQPLVQQQPVQQGQQQPVQQQSVQQQAVQQQSVQTAQAVQTQTQTQAQPQTNANAQQTAMQMLSSFGGAEATPAATPTPQPQVFNGVGTWSATLSNGATVSLDMRADSTFTWTAIKSGKQSTFSGTFNLNGQSLTLSRNDNQKLTGTLISPGTNGFTFKLNDVKDNGLQFARS